MAEATRSKANVDRLEDTIAKLTSSHLSMSPKIDDLLHRMTQFETSHHTPHNLASSSTNPSTLSPSDPSHHMKLEVPRFDGSDPTGWIFKITQFFKYHATPDHERLTIASFYMEGLALAWFTFPALVDPSRRNHQYLLPHSP